MNIVYSLLISCLDTNGTIWDDKNVQDRQLVTNPFQKATKHLKTLIGKYLFL